MCAKLYRMFTKVRHVLEYVGYRRINRIKSTFLTFTILLVNYFVIATCYVCCIMFE